MAWKEGLFEDCPEWDSSFSQKPNHRHLIVMGARFLYLTPRGTISGMHTEHAAITARAPSFDGLPWLRNARFDAMFLFGIYFMAVSTGFVVLLRPQWFYPILLIDLWVLGYHHVISTYTRLCFDRASFREHRGMVVGLLPAVAAITALVAWQAGVWVIVTIYFYWQWWHYTRQSWGISRVYRAKGGGARYDDGWLDQAIFYALPILGILNRSNQQSNFLGFDVRYVPVSEIVVDVASAAAVLLLATWLLRRVTAARDGRLPILHTIYMVTHFSIFWIGYVAIEDVSVGWLVVNMWHNAQYILFVWMFNNRRFREGKNADAKLLSYISQDGRLCVYLATCLLLTGILYWGLLLSLDWLFVAGLSATIVLFQILNFHHYIVDSLIWKVRKPRMQQSLGISS